jgi:hypothetical protein
MAFLRAFLVCQLFYMAVGLVYIFFFREFFLDFVMRRVTLQGKVSLPDFADTFDDKIVLFVPLLFLWIGELFYTISVWRDHKVG